MDINNRIKKLRELMKANNIEAYIIPSTDSHQSEYTPDHFKSREWISGFTGSAGTVVITKEKAILWTDGRYFLQASEEIKDTEVELFKMGEKDVKTMEEYLSDSLEDSSRVGLDGKVFSKKQVDKMKSVFKEKSIELSVDYDLIDEIWDDRPKLPSGKVFIHGTDYSGMSTREKLEQIRVEMSEKNSDYYLMSSLDDIAWTFNIRGRDIEYNPVVISYALIGLDQAILFINSEKLDKDTKEILLSDGVELRDYDDIAKEIKRLDNEKSIYLDLSKTSIYCYQSIPKAMKKRIGTDIVENLKSIKNDIEIENFRNCQVRDGVAMVKFLHWIDKNIGKVEMSEVSVSDKLEEFRARGDHYVSLSFETIAGYKDHGAIVHYSADEKSDYKLKREGMLLLDSGAQYLDGTTDITRTIVLGNISEEEQRDFTLVLKGHIALSKARFIYGTTGTQLDVLARMPLWEDGKDYKHGTGHGVGYLLSVHEGPQRISPVPSTIALETGMLVTNEPGFYKDGEYGIRTENILLVTDDKDNEYGDFMKFETMTLCPIDLRAVDKDLLDKDEKLWLNDYHKRVRASISEYLDEEEREWLADNTREI